MNAVLELSVVIPSFLEEENLRILLPRIRKIVSDITESFEIIVVDSFEPLDNTRLACEEFQVTYVNRALNNDFGNAVRTGIEQAKGRYILFMDADGSHPPEFIPKLFERREDYDVVIASRYIEGGFTENNRVLILMSQILNLTYRLILGLDCKDVSNSFKIYKSALLKELNLNCRNFDIIEEILFKLNKRRKIKILEIPTTFKKRMFGESKRNLLMFILGYIITILKLRFGR